MEALGVYSWRRWRCIIGAVWGCIIGSIGGVQLKPLEMYNWSGLCVYNFKVSQRAMCARYVAPCQRHRRFNWRSVRRPEVFRSHQRRCFELWERPGPFESVGAAEVVSNRWKTSLGEMSQHQISKCMPQWPVSDILDSGGKRGSDAQT